MADYIGKKIKQLAEATSLNETDDMIIESSPASGTPATKRAKLNTLSIFIKNILKIGDSGNLQTTNKNNIVEAVNELDAKVSNFSLIETGQVEISFTTSVQTAEFSFSTSFPRKPNVFVCINAGTYWVDKVCINASAKNVSTFMINHVGTGTGSVSVQWLAICV